MYKRAIKKTKHPNVYSIGEPIKKHFLYRYMPLDAFTLCLDKGNVRFAQPSLWDDNFEKRFYEGDFSTKLNAPTNTHPRLFAFCTTSEKDSEPSWLMYSKGKPTIEIKINRKKWLNVLSDYSKKIKDLRKQILFYEGVVNYNLKAEHIIILHRKNYNRGGKSYKVQGHDELFANFDLDSYLSLLLLKRPAFKHEQEIRYFAIPKSLEDNTSLSEKSLDVDMPWADVIEAIRVSDSISDDEYSELELLLQEKSIPLSKLSKFNIYNIPLPLSRKIVIEK